jgi:hypothetical protein
MFKKFTLCFCLYDIRNSSKAKRLNQLSQGLFLGAKLHQNGKQKFGAATLPKGFFGDFLTRIAQKIRVFGLGSPYLKRMLLQVAKKQQDF